jgi:hypothetical protein
MAKLYDVIQTYALAEAQASDWAGVLAKLTAKSIKKKDNKLHVLGDLMRVIGIEQTMLVGATIQQAGAQNPIMAGAWIALNTTGLQLADDERQAMLDGLALAGSWPDDTKNKVKELGQILKTPLEAYGLEVPTEQQIQDSWAQYLFEAEYIFGKQAVDSAIDSGRTAVVTALRALADSLEA